MMQCKLSHLALTLLPLPDGQEVSQPAKNPVHALCIALYRHIVLPASRRGAHLSEDGDRVSFVHAKGCTIRSL